eukprot:6476910-Amphidinium_carterae.3
MVHPISGQTEHWLHVIDWGTGFQQSERVRTKEASHVFMIYTRIWVRFFGHPSTLVVDAGRNGPWLNGRSDAELRKQVVVALQLCITLSSCLIREGPVEAVRRSEQIHTVALEAWAKVSSRQRVLASLRSRSRGAPRPFVVGERVWVWRSPGSGRAEAWYGPGAVVCLSPIGAYVSLKGSLWEVTHRYGSGGTANTVGTQRGYVDCTCETPPPLTDDEGQNNEQAALPLPNVETASATGQGEERRAVVQEEPREEEQEEPGTNMPPMQTDTNEETSLEQSRVSEHEEVPPRVRTRQQEREEMAPLFRGSRVLQSDPPSGLS